MSSARRDRFRRLTMTAFAFVVGCPTESLPPDAGALGTLRPDAPVSGDEVDASHDVREGPAPDDTDPSAFAACFDGLDQDGDGLSDCDDDECSSSGPCCVGVVNGACCASHPAVQSFDFATCPPGDAIHCAIDLRVLSGLPRIGIHGGLVLVSSEGVDAAIDFPSAPLNPRAERVALRGIVSSPITSAQIDATGFGLWVPRPSLRTVVPVVAIVTSATRGDVSLVIGDRVVASAALADGERSYELRIEPSGEVRVAGTSEPLAGSVVEWPAEEMVPVVFGRVANETAADGTTVLRSLVVERRACDVPDALSRSGASLLERDPEVGFDAEQATDPSVLVRSGMPSLVAFVAPDQRGGGLRAVFLGERLADGRITSVRRALTQADVAARLSLAVNDLGGPHLFENAGRIGLLFAFESEGRWRLGRMNDLSSPGLEALALPQGSFDDPASMRDGRLLARERLVDGGSRIVSFRQAGGRFELATELCATDLACTGGLRSSAYLHASRSDSTAFDRDEVRAPVAIELNGVTRVFFAGRRGTRWSIGMLLLGDGGRYARLGNDGRAVLEPGGGERLDALGASGPSPILVGGELELIYAGFDGVRSRLTSARMPTNAR